MAQSKKFARSRYLYLLYTSSTLRKLIISFFSLFLPILLFVQFRHAGYTVPVAMVMIGALFLIQNATHGLGTTVVASFNARFGSRYGFLIGQTLLIAFFLLFPVTAITFLPPLFLLYGFATVTWWITYHTYFLQVGTRARFGFQLSISGILETLTEILAPVIGALVLSYLGKFYAYGACAAVILISLTVILGIRDGETVLPVSHRDVWREIQRRPRDFISLIGAGGEIFIHGTVWPLFLYTVLGNFIKIGWFASLVTIFSLMLGYVAGVMTDTLPKDRLERTGAAVIASSWVARALFITPVPMFLLDLLYKLSGNFLFTPFSAVVYEHALDDGKGVYIAFSETGYKIGNILATIVFMGLAWYRLPMQWIFLLAGGCSLVTAVMRELPAARC